MKTGKGCGKFALRALSQCLAKEYQAFGIHVAHVIIDGVVGPPRYVIYMIIFLHVYKKNLERKKKQEDEIRTTII